MAFILKSSTMPFIEGQHWCREYEGDPVGPAFKVVTVRQNGTAIMFATTSITKHVITGEPAPVMMADTQDRPDGWWGPLNDGEVATIEKGQARMAKGGRA